jgi:hypothetical protein
MLKFLIHGLSLINKQDEQLVESELAVHLPGGPMTKESLARHLLEAQKVREESWTGVSYKLSNEQAARDVVYVDPEVSPDEYEAEIQLIEMLNETLWNDAQEWAKAVLGL